MLNLISSKGKPIAALLGLALALGGTGIGVMLNYWYLPPVAIVTGAVLSGILFSYVEIVRNARENTCCVWKNHAS